VHLIDYKKSTVTQQDINSDGNQHESESLLMDGIKPKGGIALVEKL